MVHPDAEFINKWQKLLTKAVCEGDLNIMMSYYVDDSLEYSDYGKFCHIQLYYATFFSWETPIFNGFFRNDQHKACRPIGISAHV